MLLEKNESCLVLVDVQEKLAPLVLNAEAIIDRCDWLLRLANELKIPCVISEQYPSGLGHTVTALQHSAKNHPNIEKVYFSCWRDAQFKKHVHELNKKQIVLIGIETHVCVLQTALDLQIAGFEVFVVVDAVSSRHEIDYKFGLKRMKQAGITLVTAEMVFFEWVEKAGTPEFKVLSKSYLK